MTYDSCIPKEDGYYWCATSLGWTWCGDGRMDTCEVPIDACSDSGFYLFIYLH
jgi:hypothetical protein